jgi:hypothetical protein
MWKINLIFEVKVVERETVNISKNSSSNITHFLLQKQYMFYERS